MANVPRLRAHERVRRALLCMLVGLAGAPSISVASAQSPPRRLASLRLPADATIRAMAVQGDTVLLGLQEGAADDLVAVDASNPLSPRIAWSYHLGASVNGIDASSEPTALLATSLDDGELIVFDLASRSIRGKYDAPGTGDGIATYAVLPLIAWLSTETNPIAPEALLIDFTDVGAPVLLGSREAIADVRTPPPPSAVAKGYLPFGDVVARGRGRARPELTFLAVNAPSGELQVVSELDDQVVIPDTNGDGFRVLGCLGDSNTFVFLDKNPGSWCHYLQQTVWSASTFVANFGFLGAKMTPAPTAQAFEQLSAAIGVGADMVIAAFGTNDVLSFTPDEIVGAANALAATAGAGGVPMLLATPTPRYDVAGTDLAQQIADTSTQLRALFPADLLLDFNGVVGETELGPDHLHVNLAGALAEGRLARERIVAADARTFTDPCAVRTAAHRPRLKLAGLDTPIGDERLAFAGTVTLAPAVPVDPATSGAQVMVFGASGAILFEEDVPPGPDWKTNRARTRFRYRSRSGPGGITRVSIAARGRRPGTYAVEVRADPASIPFVVDDAPLTGSVLLAPASGACAAVAFAGGRGPACTLGRHGLVCR